jgi:hypothetical protein
VDIVEQQMNVGGYRMTLVVMPLATVVGLGIVLFCIQLCILLLVLSQVRLVKILRGMVDVMEADNAKRS